MSTRVERFVIFGAILLCLSLSTYGIVTNAYTDLIQISAPSNPASGNSRLYANSGTHVIACLNSDGSSCTPAGAVTSVGGLTGAVPGGLVLKETHSASSSASLSFTTCFATAGDYFITISDLIPATSASNLYLRFNSDSGNNYSWAGFRASSGGDTNAGGQVIAQIDLASGTAGASISNWGYVGHFMVTNPSSTSAVKRIVSSVNAFDGGTGSAHPDVINMVGGTYNTTSAVTTMQILASSGNLTSGTVNCYWIATQ